MHTKMLRYGLYHFQDVSNARLAQRRKNKKSSTDARSHSSTSSLSSTSSASSLTSVRTPSKSDRCSSSLGATPKKEESIFDFGEARVKAYLSSIESSSEISFPATPSMVLTLPSPRSKGSSKGSSLGSFDFSRGDRCTEPLSKSDTSVGLSPEISSPSSSTVSYKKQEQCLAFQEQCDVSEMQIDASETKSSESPLKSSLCALGNEFSGPQTRSRKRKLEKICDADVTVVKHMFKGRNTRSRRFDTIVIDD